MIKMTNGFPPMPGEHVRLCMPSRRDAAAEAIGRIMRDVEGAGFDEAGTFAIRLSLEEALSNAVRHGNCSDPGKQVVIEYHVGPGAFAVDIEDEGCGFDPACIPDPTLDENIERPSGRGIMLMRAYMSRVMYNEQGNRVALRFFRQS